MQSLMTMINFFLNFSSLTLFLYVSCIKKPRVWNPGFGVEKEDLDKDYKKGVSVK